MDRAFTYTHNSEIKPFIRVLCDFGNQKLVGIVIAEEAPKDFDFEVKDIIEILDDSPRVGGSQYAIAKWVSHYYQCSLGEAFSLFLSFTRSNANRGSAKLSECVFQPSVDLSPEQNAVVAEYKKALEKGQTGFLLHGITGSGKTFVYIYLLLEVMQKGGQGILLLPEIALTPQTEKTFKHYFPPDELAIIHSKIPLGKKIKIYDEFRKGRVKVVIGTRSALFAVPMNLKLIIVDEEHENTYKNSQTPRYHVRQITQVMCKHYGASYILGSATPSAETFFHAKQGTIKLLQLDRRYSDSVLPESKFIKVDKEIVSPEIISRLAMTLEKGKQAIVYINRRGYSSAVQCLDCGFIKKCPRCSVTLNFHKDKGALLCHYCNFKERLNAKCFNCGSERAGFMGMGIEKIEEYFKKELPQAKYARVDSDTFSSPNVLKKTLIAFQKKEIDVLIGTQIVSKGHDFPDVTDVYILFPELGLTIPDFRANERTFSQVTQVSGRAGRRGEKGKVFIQTNFADHFAIANGKEQSYESFMEDELKIRKEFGYPPYKKICRLVFRGLDVRKVIKKAEDAKFFFESHLDGEAEMLGPSSCAIEKVKKNHRWNILFKIKEVNSFLALLKEFRRGQKVSHDVYIEIDMDPYDLI